MNTCKAMFITIPLLLGSISSAYSFGPGEERVTVRDIDPGGLSEELDIPGRRVFYGGFMIEEGRVVKGPVIVINGSLDLQSGARLEGDAWVINGKIVLTGEAEVSGRVILVNSDDFVSYQGKVGRGFTRYKCPCRLDYEIFEADSTVVFKEIEDPLAVTTDFSFRAGTPCRVDYNIIDLGIERRNPKHKDPYTKVEAYIHLPLWKESGGFIGFDAELMRPLQEDRLFLFARAFDKTETQDDWQIPRFENGIFVIGTGDDFADYFERRGGEGGIIIRSEKNIELETAVSFQRDVSLRARSIPSLLSNREKFSPNPPVEEGNRLAGRILLKLDTRDETGWNYGGWRLSLLLEKGVADGPGDFSYALFDLDAARYWEPFRGIKLDLRGKLFSTFSSIPCQLTRSINGLGGIRGLSDHPFPCRRGNRLSLFSIELRKSIPDLPVLEKILSNTDFMVFSDVGILADEKEAKAPFRFLETSFGEWGKTAGIGVSGRTFFPYVGLYLAEDLESEDFSPRVIIRMNRSF